MDQGRGTGAIGGGRVLLADDNAEMRVDLERLLTEHGFAVDAVADGDAALAAARRSQPQLIVANVTLPGMDGLELLARVRADPALMAVPFVLLSARAGEDARAEGIGAGADDYLLKPVAPRDLVACVSAHLGLARDRREAALRESEERQAFLLALGDALRPLADPVAIQEAASRSTAEHLDIGRVAYCEIRHEPDVIVIVERDWPRHGMPSIAAGRYRMDDFGPFMTEALTAGRPAIVADAIADTRISQAEREKWGAFDIVASCAVPVMKEGRFVAYLVAQDNRPHDWTEQEVALLREVSERTWAAVERSRAEGALRDSEGRFRALAETAPALIWRNDAAGHNVFVNRYFLDYIGLDAAEVCGEKWRALVHPDDAEAYVADYMAAVREQRPFHNRNRIRRHDGAWRWFENHAQPLLNAQGRYVGHVGVSTDVTTTVEADQALRESDARHRLLIGSWAQAVWETDPDGVVVADSPSWRAYTGQTVDEWLGYGWLDAVHPDDRAYAERQWREAVEARGLVDAEFRLRTPHGEWRWTNVRATPVPDAQGHVVKWAGMNFDIDARKLADAALRESEERFRAIAEQTEVGIAMADREGCLLWVNDRLAKISGRSLDEMRGLTIRDVTHPDDWPQNEALFCRMIDDGTPFVVEKRIARSGDANHWHRLSVSPRRDAEGTIIGGIAVVVDITDRKRAEKTLLESEAKYRTLFESIDEGICIIEYFEDGDGQSPDYRYLEVNAAFKRLTGLSDVTGKLGSEVLPQAEAYWYETYREIIRTGEPRRFENYNRDTGRWYNVFASRVGDAWTRQVCIVFEDVTERRQREDRQAFALRLSDALRDLETPEDVGKLAMQLLVDQLKLDRCWVCSFSRKEGLARLGPEYCPPGMTPMSGEYALRDFPETMRQVETASPAIADVRHDPTLTELDRTSILGLGMGAYMTTILRKADQEYVWAICASTSGPREWTDNDRRLLDDVTERVWAAMERARAEEAQRTSERRLAEELSGSQLLQRLSTRLIPEQSSEVLHEQMMDAALELMQADAVSIQLLDEDGERLRRLATRNLHPDSTEYWTWVDASHASTCGMALGANSRVIMEDVEASAALAGTADLAAFRASGTRAVQSTPLVTRSGRPIGMISTHWRKPRRLSEQDFGLFDILARQVADLLERARTEAALRASEERQAFLLKLSDALRLLSDPEEIRQTAASVLGRQLGASRVAYADDNGDGQSFTVYANYVDDAPDMTGRFRYIDFGPDILSQLRAGKNRIQPDVASDGSLNAAQRQAFADVGIAASMNVPLVKAGRLVAFLGVNFATAHDFAPQEVGLAEETAERTWAAVERLRAEDALRESQARLQQFGEASQDVLWIRDAETLQWQYLTPAFETIYGLNREEALSGDNLRGWLDLIVPEDRHTATDAIRRVRAGEHVTFDYRIRRPSDGSIRWLRNTDFPITDASGKVALVGGVGHDLTELREAELRLQTLIEGIPQLVWRAVDGGHWTWASPQWTDFTGQAEEDSHDFGWLEPVHPDDRERVREIWSGAMAKGEFAADYRVRHAGEGRYRWFQTRAAPVRDSGGLIVEWLGTSTDIDELRSLQERQQVLVAELQHRTFNLMGMVRSTADATIRSSASLDEFKPKFRDRIAALARVQRLLSRLKDDDRVTFDELIRGELEAIGALQGGDGRVTLDGPNGVALRSSTVQTLAMAIHELTTNAVKYGALKQAGARLNVRWHVAVADGNQPWLYVEWRETGVSMPPAGAAPQGTGQGRTLIEEALPYQLRARTTYVMASDGVRCSIALPVSARSLGEAELAAS